MPTIKFRQDTVRTLPYVGRGGKHQCIYWDANLEGFGVRVYPTGGRTYVCTYRVNRRKRLAKLGRVDVLTLDQATKKAKAYLGKVANNDDPLEQSDAIKKAPTVEDLVKAYIEGHAKPQKKTWKQDESSLRRNLVADFRPSSRRILPRLKLQRSVSASALNIPMRRTISSTTFARCTTGGKRRRN